MPLIFDRNRFFIPFERPAVFFFCFVIVDVVVGLILYLIYLRIHELRQFRFLFIIITQFIVYKCIYIGTSSDNLDREFPLFLSLRFFLCLVLLLVYNQLVRSAICLALGRAHTHSHTPNLSIIKFTLCASSNLSVSIGYLFTFYVSPSERTTKKKIPNIYAIQLVLSIV